MHHESKRKSLVIRHIKFGLFKHIMFIGLIIF